MSVSAEHIVVREPTDVMLVRVADQLPEIQRAWASFEAAIGLGGRKFYGQGADRSGDIPAAHWPIRLWRHRVTPKTWVEPRSAGKSHAVSVSGSHLIWHVEVELAARRRRQLVTMRRLRGALESDSELIQVRNQPWLERLLLRSLPPTIRSS